MKRFIVIFAWLCVATTLMADMQPVFMETFDRCIDPSQPFYTLFGVCVEGSYTALLSRTAALT